jgi:hypothetical protein
MAHELRDLALRALWTSIETFLGVMIGSGVLSLDVTVTQAGAMAAATAVATLVIVFARQQSAKLDAAAATPPPVDPWAGHV